MDGDGAAIGVSGAALAGRAHDDRPFVRVQRGRDVGGREEQLGRRRARRALGGAASQRDGGDVDGGDLPAVPG